MPRVLIIGGGPAGLSAAYHLAKEGYRVELFELSSKDRFPMKPCGEALPHGALKHVPIDIKPYVLNRVRWIDIYFYEAFLKRIRGMPLYDGFIINKREFLLGIAEAAESFGARIIWGKGLSVARVLKCLSDYDYVLDASGKGNVARLFLNYKNYEMIPVLQAYAKGSLDDDVATFWGTDYGYGWVFPRGDEYNIGIGGYAKIATLERDLRRMVRQFRLNIRGRIRYSSVSSGGPLRKLVKGKIRALGEAAGMVMPATGEGIRYALFAGEIALRDDYEKLFWKTYGHRMVRSRKILRKALAMRNKAEILKNVGTKTIYRAFEGDLTLTLVGVKLIRYLIRKLRRKIKRYGSRKNLPLNISA